MKNETKIKKGFFAMLRESFSKTKGCCCGPGETCDGSGKKIEAKPKVEPARSDTMKRIQILGTGCAKCTTLAANAETAVKALGGEYAVEHVSEITQIKKFGVMTTPALAVDGVVKSVGKVLDAEQIKKLIQ